MMFVCTAPLNYCKPWLFPSLNRLSCRVVALLDDADKTNLPSNVERRSYSGNVYYQDGSFLDALPEAKGGEVILLGDADAVIQRDLSESERKLLNDLGENDIAIGWNIRPDQRGDEECKILAPKCPIDNFRYVFGLHPQSVADVKVYNCGLIAARVSLWKRVRQAYKQCGMHWRGCDHFYDSHWMQLMLCVTYHRMGLRVVEMGFEWHSHGHFGLTERHEMKDGVLRYDGQPVFFAHNLSGVVPITPPSKSVPINFLVTAPPNYHKGWIFPSLRLLKSCHRVFTLLEPQDSLSLPENVTRVDHVGDKWYQDGRFLDSLDKVTKLNPEEIVVIADADGVVQRDFSAEEVSLLSGVGDGVAMGYNRDEGQTCDSEWLACRPLCAWQDINPHFGVDLSRIPMRNAGLIAAKVKTWRKLRRAWEEAFMIGENQLSDYTFCQQLFICITLVRSNISLVTLGYEVHTHGLGSRVIPTVEHRITDRKLYYRDQLVFFAHFIPGVTH